MSRNGEAGAQGSRGFRRAFAEAVSGTARGRAAESEAVRFLVARGYRVLARNVRNRAGEIDVVALEAGVLCFVEVKARTGREGGSALERVDHTKRRRLARAAALWLALDGWEGFCRFDVVALDRADADSSWEITLVRDAFEVDEAGEDPRGRSRAD